MMFHADLSGITAVIPASSIPTTSITPIPTSGTPTEKPYTCPECHRGFTQKVHLKTHLMQHSGEKPFSCEVCGRGFIQKIHLRTHMGLHIDQKIHGCAICGEEFSLKELLTVHSLVHAIDSPFTCVVCNKEYTSRIHLEAHTAVHCREKPHICSQCGKGFIQKGHLKTHMMVHSGEKPYSCTQCGKGFTQKVHLHTHLAVHSGMKHFKCSICEKEFTQRGNLDRHLRIHSGLRPFKCAICGVSFTQKANLKSHMVVHAFKKSKAAAATRTEEGETSDTGNTSTPPNMSDIYYAQGALMMPTEIKLYRCNVCSKAFTRNGNLKTHMYVHSGDRPFQCNVCQKRFSQNVHLKKHMGVHNGGASAEGNFVNNGRSEEFPGHFIDEHRNSPYYVKEEPRQGGIKNETDEVIGHNQVKHQQPPDNGVGVGARPVSGKHITSNSVGVNTQNGGQVVNTHAGVQIDANNLAIRDQSNGHMNNGNNMVVRTQASGHVPVSLPIRTQPDEPIPTNSMTGRTQANNHAPANSMVRHQPNINVPINSMVVRNHIGENLSSMNARTNANEIASRNHASGQMALNTLSARSQGSDLLAANIMGIRNQTIGQVAMNTVGVRGIPGEHVHPNIVGVRSQMSEQMMVGNNDKIMNNSKDLNSLNKRLLINSYVSPFPTYHYHNPIVLAAREEGAKYDENNVDILG